MQAVKSKSEFVDGCGAAAGRWPGAVRQVLSAFPPYFSIWGGDASYQAGGNREGGGAHGEWRGAFLHLHCATWKRTQKTRFAAFRLTLSTFTNKIQF